MSFAFEAQIGRAALQRFVRTLHAADGMLHRGTHYRDGRLFDYVLGCPEIRLLESAGDTAVELRTRICTRSRPIGDAAAAGQTAVVDAPLRCVFRLPPGDPAPVDGKRIMQVDVSLPKLPPGAVVATDLKFRAVLNAVMPAIVSRYSPRVAPIPPLVVGGQGIVSVARKVLRGGRDDAILALGFNTQAGGDGSRSLGAIYLEHDWTVRIPQDRFIAALGERLRTAMPMPYRISRRCSMTSPFGGGACWNWETVSLREATVGILGDAISVAGTIFVRNSGELVPDATVNFVAMLGVSLTPAGTIATNVRSVTVALREWYANVANFFSGNSFRTTIEQAIRDAMEAQAGRAAAMFVGLEAIQTLAAFGGAVALPLELQPRSVKLSPLGLTMSGDLLAREERREPEAAFRAIKVGPQQFLLNARESWAPGGQIVRYEWKDPQRTDPPVVSSGSAARYVEQHTVDLRIRDHLGAFLQGTRPVARMCLTVTDDQGVSATTCRELDTDPLTLTVDTSELHHVAMRGIGVPSTVFVSARRPWGEGPTPIEATDAADWMRAGADLYEHLVVFTQWRGDAAITLRAAESDAKDKGVVRLISASGWKHEGRLDAHGRLRFSVPLRDAIAGARPVSIARDVLYGTVTSGNRTGGRLILWLTTVEDRRQLLATVKKAQPAGMGAIDASRAAASPQEPGAGAGTPDPVRVPLSRAGWSIDRALLRRRMALRRVQAGAGPVELRRGLAGPDTPKEFEAEFERLGIMLRAIAKQAPELNVAAATFLKNRADAPAAPS